MSLGLVGQGTLTAPGRMSYQGYLTGADGAIAGSPAPKAYDMVFRIYDAPTGGNLVWAEQQAAVVDNGYFAVQLGEGDPVGGFSNPAAGLAATFTDPSGGARWVELTVNGFAAGGGNVTISPRVQLVSAPYAYLAQSAAALVDSSGNALISLSSTNLVVSAPLTASSISVASLSVGSITISNSLTIGGSGGGSGFARTPASLRVVSGRHRWTNGAPASGTFLSEPSPGYSVTRVSKGEYKVTFDTAFSAPPTVTVTTIVPMNNVASDIDGSLWVQNVPISEGQGQSAYGVVVQAADATTASKEFTLRFYSQRYINAYNLITANWWDASGWWNNDARVGGASVFTFHTTPQIDWDFAFVAAGN
jgi:hypothetical protein